jgi:hypothetical protein
MFENGRPADGSLSANERSGLGSTRYQKKECDDRWKHPINLTGADNGHDTLMIWMVGVLMQPFVQRRRYRHDHNRKQRGKNRVNKNLQERRSLVFSPHWVTMRHSRKHSALSTAIFQTLRLPRLLLGEG